MIRPMNPGDRQAYISMAAAFYASDAVIRKVTVQVVESVFDDIMAGSPHIDTNLRQSNRHKERNIVE